MTSELRVWPPQGFASRVYDENLSWGLEAGEELIFRLSRLSRHFRHFRHRPGPRREVSR